MLERYSRARLDPTLLLESQLWELRRGGETRHACSVLLGYSLKTVYRWCRELERPENESKPPNFTVIFELHLDGLTDAQIAGRTGYPPGDISAVVSHRKEVALRCVSRR